MQHHPFRILLTALTPLVLAFGCASERPPLELDLVPDEDGKSDLVSRTHLVGHLEPSVPAEGRLLGFPTILAYTFDAPRGAEMTLRLTSSAGPGASVAEGEPLDTFLAIYGPYVDGVSPGEAVSWSDDGSATVDPDPVAYTSATDETMLAVFVSWDEPGRASTYRIELSCAGPGCASEPRPASPTEPPSPSEPSPGDPPPSDPPATEDPFVDGEVVRASGDGEYQNLRFYSRADYSCAYDGYPQPIRCQVDVSMTRLDDGRLAVTVHGFGNEWTTYPYEVRRLAGALSERTLVLDALGRSSSQREQTDLDPFDIEASYESGALTVDLGAARDASTSCSGHRTRISCTVTQSW